MITNLWSTPRTGSVWYSCYLSKILGATRITEMFNPYHMDLYCKLKNGNILNYHEYSIGSYYHEYYLDSYGLLCSKKIYKQRTRDLLTEQKYRYSLIKNMNINNNLIMHNHVLPIDEEIRQYLTGIATDNIYIYRRDRRAQLSSYTIAYTTKIFASFKQKPTYSNINTLPIEPVINLAKRIRRWDEIPKFGKIIAYEDIDFNEDDGMPKKQVDDYASILSKYVLDQIDIILKEYKL